MLLYAQCSNFPYPLRNITLNVDKLELERVAITEEAMRDSDKRSEEKKMQEERRHEILLLLEHLVSYEEITIKLIIDCLYDVGSVNLINQRVQLPLLKRPLKGVAGISKPIVKVIAFRWFKRNCPQIITNWLFSKVAFPPLAKPIPVPPPLPDPVVPEQIVPELITSVESEHLSREVRRLRGQVRLLSGVSIGAIAALGGVLVWMTYRPEMQSSQPLIHPLQPAGTETTESWLLRSQP
jgi:hypothetical protein